MLDDLFNRLTVNIFAVHFEQTIVDLNFAVDGSRTIVCQGLDEKCLIWTGLEDDTDTTWIFQTKAVSL